MLQIVHLSEIELPHMFRESGSNCLVDGFFCPLHQQSCHFSQTGPFDVSLKYGYKAKAASPLLWASRFLYGLICDSPGYRNLLNTSLLLHSLVESEGISVPASCLTTTETTGDYALKRSVGSQKRGVYKATYKGTDLSTDFNPVSHPLVQPLLVVV